MPAAAARWTMSSGPSTCRGPLPRCMPGCSSCGSCSRNGVADARQVKASGPTMTQIVASSVSIRKTLNQNALASAMLVTVTITRRNLPGGQLAVRQLPAAKISLATVQSSATVRGHAPGSAVFSGVALPELLSAARPGTADGPLIPRPED